MELLERESCVADLHACLLDAAAGRGRVVFLGGEAGVGKSVLVRQFADHHGNSARILLGACDPLSHPRPLGPLYDAAPALGTSIGELLRDHERRSELFSVVLNELSSARATLYIVEDAHWADDATLDLLRFLGRRIGSTSALVIVTYRDDEIGVSHPLRILLGDLATSADVRRMSLSPLSEAAVRTLARGSQIDPETLHRQSGGNPFFVTEVLSSGTMGIPPTIRDAVLNRAARLSARARAALDAAAVIGSRIEPGLLKTITGMDAGAVEECLSAGLLQARDGVIVFRHELVRDALLSVMSPIKSIELNGMALAALQRGFECAEDHARLAHHAEAAGNGEAVLHFAPLAARRSAALGAHRTAAAQYARALRFAGRLPAEQRETLLELRLAECHQSGQTQDSLELVNELITLARAAGNQLAEARHLCSHAVILAQAGRNAEAELASRTAIDLVDAFPPGPTHALAYCTQAYLRMLHRDNTAAIDWGERAAALAERFDDVAVRARALNASGSARILIDVDDEQGRADLERSLAIAQSAHLDAHVAGAFTNLGSAFGEGFRFEIAERYLTQGLAFTGERDLDQWHWYMVAWLAIVRMYQGRWSEAVELGQQVIEYRSASAISRMMALIALGRVRARRGDPEVWPILDEALALAEPTCTLQRLAPVRCARAEAAWLEGNLQQTAAEARAVFDLALDHRHRWHIGELGFWLRLAGEMPSTTHGAADPFSRQIEGGWSAAANLWRELGCPYETARALAESFTEPAMREAWSTFDRLGARPMAGRVNQRLRDLGAAAIPRGPRSSTRANPAGLTSREMQVLRLVAQGQTNPEIASQLFVAPKTVQHHVSAILGKLGAKSRQEAAAIAANREITDPADVPLLPI